MSQRPCVVKPKAQGAAVLGCATKGQDSANTSKSPMDLLADLESNERMEVERNKGVGEKENSEELPADEVSAKMEVDPADLLSDEEQSMKKCSLVSKSIVFICMWSMSCATHLLL